MTEPRLDDGYTNIPNGLIETLSYTNLSAYEGRIVWCVIRKTYGWNKRVDRISYSQFEADTGINRWHIARTIDKLKARRILICQGDGYKLEYGIQADRALWLQSLPSEVMNSEPELLPQEVTNSLPVEVINTEIESLPLQEKSLPLQEKPLPQEVTNSLPKEVNTKERNNITKDNTKEIVGSSTPRPLSAGTPAARYLFEKTSRKRWANIVQKEEFEAAEAEVGEERMKEAIRWALTSGIPNVKAIITTARRKNRDAPRQKRGEGIQTHGADRRYTQAPTDEQYRRGIRPRPPP